MKHINTTIKPDLDPHADLDRCQSHTKSSCTEICYTRTHQQYINLTLALAPTPSIWKPRRKLIYKDLLPQDSAKLHQPSYRPSHQPSPSRKARRKLIYRELLPQYYSAMIRLSISTECTAQCGQVITIPSRFYGTYKKESDQLAHRLNKRPSNESARNASHNNKCPSKSMSPSLLLAQEDFDDPWIERCGMTDDLADTRNIRYTANTSEEHHNPMWSDQTIMETSEFSAICCNNFTMRTSFISTFAS